MLTPTQNTQEIQFAKIAQEVIRELITRVLTLSTGLIAAAVALGKILGIENLPMKPFSIGLICFAISIFFGLLTQMTIVSTIANGSIDVARDTLVRIMAALHLLSFFLGIISIIWLAIYIN